MNLNIKVFHKLKVMQPLLIALQFLTRFPVKSRTEWDEKNTALSILYYPLVGLIIGFVLWFSAVLLDGIVPMIGAVVVLILWVLITGGLHLDGLADSADAWAGGYADKQRSLDIMKDPAAGPFAVVVLVLLLLVKYITLVTIIENHQFWLLCIAPILGRLSVIVLFITTPYVREQGLGSKMAEHLERKFCYSVLIFTLILAAILMPAMMFLIILSIIFVVLYFLRYLMMQRLQGMTGDTIGASVEIIEAVSLFVLAVLVSY